MNDEPNEQPLDAVGDGDGRGPRGRFGRGNQFGKANPHARKAQQLRGAVMRAVTTGELRTIIKALVTAAAGGDVAAAKVVLERSLGQPVAWDFEERLARVESILQGGSIGEP